MISLLKLELKKFNLLNYIISFLLITVAILGMITLIGVADTEEEVIFGAANELLGIGDIFIRITFTIFSGVLLARIIINEFKDSTIKIMFTYPISRKKIIGAKLIIVWTFIFIAIILDSLLIGIGLKMIDDIINITPDTITYSDILGRSSAILYSALVTSGLGLIPLFFGMQKKSSPTTIVAAVIVSLLLNGSVGNNGATLFTVTVVPVFLCIMGVVIAFLSYWNINKADIN